MNRAGRLLVMLSILCMISPSAWSMGSRPPSEVVVMEKEKESIKLEDCYRLALKRSETIAMRKEEIEVAEAQFFAATGDAIGEVNFVMERRRQDIQKGGGESSSVGGTLSDIDRRERKFRITQPLFRGFKALGGLMGAGSLKKTEKEEWVRAKQLLFTDVASAFYGLLQAARDLKTIEETHRLLEERIKELEEREKIGRSRPSEVATAKTRMKIVEAELARARGVAEVAKHLIEFLTGVFLESEILKEEDLPEGIYQTLPRFLETLDTRPDVEAAEQAVKTARGNVIVAQSGFWPEFSAEHTQYERREGFQSNLDWDFLFTIDVPLFKGGETWAAFKEAVSEWKKTKFSYSLARRQAELEIKEAYQNWIASLDEAKALEDAVEASEENFRLQREDYERNLVSNLDVLEALESLFETQRKANRIHYQMKQNFWQLQVAAGRCCEERVEPS